MFSFVIAQAIPENYERCSVLFLFVMTNTMIIVFNHLGNRELSWTRNWCDVNLRYKNFSSFHERRNCNEIGPKHESCRSFLFSFPFLDLPVQEHWFTLMGVNLAQQWEGLASITLQITKGRRRGRKKRGKRIDRDQDRVKVKHITKWACAYGLHKPLDFLIAQTFLHKQPNTKHYIVEPILQGLTKSI